MKGSWSSLCLYVVVLPWVCRAEPSLQLLLDKSSGPFYSSTYLYPTVTSLTNLSLLSVPPEFAWLDPLTTVRNFTSVNLTALPRGRRGAIELPFQSVLLPNWRLWNSPMECVANNTISEDCWAQLNTRSLQKSKFSFFYTLNGFLSLDSDAPFSLARERVEVDTDSSCQERSRIPYDGCSGNCPCNCSYGMFLPPGIFLRRFYAEEVDSISQSEAPLLVNWTGPLYSDAMNSSLPMEGIAFRYVDSFYLSNDNNPSALLWVAETECIVPSSSSDAALYQTICERFNFTAQVELYTNGSHTYRFWRIPQDGFHLTPTLRISSLTAGLFMSIGGTVPPLGQLQFDLPKLSNVSNGAFGSFLVPLALSEILERDRPNAALGFLAVRFELSIVDDYCSNLSLKVHSGATKSNLRQQLCISCSADPLCWWFAAAGGGQGTCLSVMSSIAFSDNHDAARIASHAIECDDFVGKALESSDAYRLHMQPLGPELITHLQQQVDNRPFRTSAELIPRSSMFSYRFNDTSFGSYRQLQSVFTNDLGGSIQYVNPGSAFSEIYYAPVIELFIDSFCGPLGLSAQINFQEKWCTAPSYCTLTSDVNVAPWRQCNCTVISIAGMVLSPAAVNMTVWVELYHESGVIGFHWSASAPPLNRLTNWQHWGFRGHIVNSSFVDNQRWLHFDSTRFDIPPALLLMANQSVYFIPSVWCPPCYFGSCNEVLLVCECDDGWSGEMCSDPETGLTAQSDVVNSSVHSTLMEMLQCLGGGSASRGCVCQRAATGPRCEYRCNTKEEYFLSLCVFNVDFTSFCRCSGRRVVTAPVGWYCANAAPAPCVEDIESTRTHDLTIDATVDGLISWNATKFVTALASANRTSLVWELVLGYTYDELFDLVTNNATSSRLSRNDWGNLSFTWLAVLMTLTIVIVAISVGLQCRFVRDKGDARGDAEVSHCDVQDQLHLILNGPSKM